LRGAGEGGLEEKIVYHHESIVEEKRGRGEHLINGRRGPGGEETVSL